MPHFKRNSLTFFSYSLQKVITFVISVMSLKSSGLTLPTYVMNLLKIVDIVNGRASKRGDNASNQRVY